MLDDIARRAMQSHVKASLKKKPKGVKLKPELVGDLAKAEAVKNHLAKIRTVKETIGNAPTSQVHYADEFWHMPGKLAKQTQVDAALAAKGFRFRSSPLGKKGYNQNLLAIAHNERRLGNDEFIQPEVLQKKVDEVLGPEQRYFKGEKMKIQSAGKAKPHAIAANPDQRPLMIATTKSRAASKMSNTRTRAAHRETQEYKDMKKLGSRLNKEATERAIAAGTHIPDHQYVSVEHNARLSGNPLFKETNEGGIGKRGNEKWNIYIQTNEQARWFKDYMEDWFYSNKGAKSLGADNFYLINDLSNKKDLKIMEVSTGKTLGIIKFPNDYTRGDDITEHFTEALRIIREKASK